MTKKYEKPYSVNLGEMLPNAEGYCVSIGNSANRNPGSSCYNGGSALGGICVAPGGFPNTQACQPGSVPVYFGCLSGDSAQNPCNTGNRPHA